MKKIITLFIIIGLLFSVNSVISSKANIVQKNQTTGYKKITTLTTSVDIQEIIDNIEESHIIGYLEEFVNNYPYRIAGSQACDNAGTYIYEEFNSMSDNLDVNYYNWEGYGKIWKPIPHYEHFTGKNIIATLPGNLDDPVTFIFCAQYDCNKNSPGALDNGAGVAALLTVAKVLSQYEFPHTIKFVSFSGEEQGLLGSYAYTKEIYENEEKVMGVIAADVIGNNTKNLDEPHVLMAYATHPVKWIVNLMDEISNSHNLGINMGFRNYHGNSDDKSFDDYGFGAMQLFQASVGMENIYGGPDDTIDIINFSYLTDVTKTIAGCLAELGSMSGLKPFVTIEFPEENTKYKNGKPVMLSLSNGETISKGNITIELSVSDEVTNVVFELIEGENEYDPPGGRKVLYTLCDDTSPYEWTVGYNYTGWNTIRATAYNEYGASTCDEIEIKFEKSSGSSSACLKYMQFLEKFPLLEKLLQFTFLKKYID